ncbi:MAG: hypothetical protein HGA22_01050 [Clostridiales bacterium]|nr:hypothetical protein [Clostridiales bacterium]
MKRAAALLVVITIIMTFAIPAFAYKTGESDNSVASTTTAGNVYTEPSGTGGTAVEGELPEEILAMLSDKDTKTTDQFMLTITRPDEDTDSTYKKSYVISGDTLKTDYENVRVVLGTYDETTKSYKLMKNADGESSWDVGDYGAFAKEIILSKGANQIRILAYNTTETEEFSAENVQVCDFTVKLLDQNILTKVVNSVINIIDLQNVFDVK